MVLLFRALRAHPAAPASRVLVPLALMAVAIAWWPGSVNGQEPAASKTGAVRRAILDSERISEKEWAANA